MFKKCKQVVVARKARHAEMQKLDECPNDTVAQDHIKMFTESESHALEPVDQKVVSGECLPDESSRSDMEIWSPTETLLQPNSINQAASIERLTLIEQAGYQNLCLDVADAIKAENSLEKMLAHQLATCHAEAMKLVTKAATSDPEMAVKVLATSTRFMEIYLKGFEAIHRVKRGNHQTVVVRYQQVNVTAGGQAVIAELAGGKRKRRGDAKK